MIKMPDTKSRFFSVKHSTRIQGALYIPSVCYPLSTGLQTVIEEMAAKDMARIYTEKVRFVTGIPYPVKKRETGAAVPRPSSVSTPDVKDGDAVKQTVKKTRTAPEKQQGRKSRRSAYTSRVDREFD
jgi:hypothetical protein